ncbi:disulfide bond formation protein B [Candidatus Nitrotoga fabula]|uniref:Disulfide bond formation protein B n=1 Tax=Candidatus Nitrotoga fabula TaxID=2182327 RepID=A0A916BD87_9PROT|nr:disulfide bond formation protein B [Candidatus Nitrotoga fabula]CAE6720428.1 Disulfide bond formation protein B [Candidatus Nitrotoga fabula]
MIFPNRCYKLSNRWFYLAAALVIAVVFGTALYLQYVLHQEPCPLCMIQRVIFIAMLVLFAMAALHNPGRGGAKAYAGLLSFLAISGVAAAGRHIWLQHLPKEQVPACGPGLDYMLESFPMAEVWKELMHGSGECAEKGWTLLGLGIPEWSLLLYVLLGAWAVMIAFRKSA